MGLPLGTFAAAIIKTGIIKMQKHALQPHRCVKRPSVTASVARSLHAMMLQPISYYKPACVESREGDTKFLHVALATPSVLTSADGNLEHSAGPASWPRTSCD